MAGEVRGHYNGLEFDAPKTTVSQDWSDKSDKYVGWDSTSKFLEMRPKHAKAVAALPHGCVHIVRLGSLLFPFGIRKDASVNREGCAFHFAVTGQCAQRSSSFVWEVVRCTEHYKSKPKELVTPGIPEDLRSWKLHLFWGLRTWRVLFLISHLGSKTYGILVLLPALENRFEVRQCPTVWYRLFNSQSARSHGCTHAPT